MIDIYLNPEEDVVVKTTFSGDNTFDSFTISELESIGRKAEGFDRFAEKVKANKDILENYGHSENYHKLLFCVYIAIGEIYSEKINLNVQDFLISELETTVSLAKTRLALAVEEHMARIKEYED